MGTHPDSRRSMSPLTHSPHVRKLAAVLGVATLGSTGAYAIGTQVGDGVAGAKQSSSAKARGPSSAEPSSAELSALADKLGVSTAKLKAALDATRPAKPTTKHSTDPFVAALAK